MALVRLQSTLSTSADSYFQKADELDNVKQLMEKLAQQMERVQAQDPDAGHNKKMEQLRTLFESVCNNQEDLKTRSKALEIAAGPSGSCRFGEVDWVQELQRCQNEANSDQGAARNDRIRQAMKDYDKQVWNVNHRGESMPGEDEDIVMVDAKFSYKDPISGDYLQNPVRNTLCGHVYSKESIFAMLCNRREIKCPVAGCGKRVSKKSLVRDARAEKEVKAYLKNQKKTKTNADMDLTQAD